MKKKISLLAGVYFGVVISFYLGAMLDFAPFVADNLVIRAIGFCTLIICMVVAICTCLILHNK